MPYWESDAFNVYSYLRDASPQIEKQLVDALKVREEGYYFNALYRAGRWDGFAHFFDAEQKRVLTGMIPFIRQMGFDFEEVITATDPLPEFNYVELINPKTQKELELNSYQVESIEKIVRGIRRGIFDHLTASGKSAVIAAIACLLRPLNVLVIVPPLIDLLIQIKEGLGAMLDEKIGQLGSGRKDLDKRVVVAHSGFLKRTTANPFTKTLAQRTQVLIVDELHRTTPREFTFFRKCTNAYYRYGLSGSFFDIDPARVFSIAGHFGGVITTATDEDTMREGRTVPPKFTFFEYPIVDRDGSNYDKMYEDTIVHNEGYNDFFARQLKEPYEAGKTILVLVQRIHHSHNFQDSLAKQFIESELYNGRINRLKRKELLRDFKKGKLPVLVATEQTMGLGIDIPRIDLCLNLGGGDSISASRQKWGRSLRSFEEKESVDIYEPYITVNKILLRHSKARLAAARRYATGKVKLVMQKGIVREF